MFCPSHKSFRRETAMNPAPEDREKWALLVGINEYPNFDPAKSLKGCVNDAETMKQVLVESFKFPEDHITLLTNGQATRAGILQAMRDLAAEAGEGDIVVFHYSGHGSRMPDREGDEPDGWDETIVPYDSGRDPLPNLDISDDEIYVWLHSLTRKTSKVTLIFDSCHSGSMTRDVFASGVRGLEEERRPLEQLPPSPIPLEARGLLDGKRDLGASGLLPLGSRYAFFAGCRPNEQSFEVREVSSGEHHGALTFHLVRELAAARPGTTCRDVFEAVAPRVTSLVPDQHPQLEGARDLAIFGVRWIEPMSFVPILCRKGDKVKLGAGTACGLTPGSRWTVYEAGTKAAADEMALGDIELISIGALSSEGRILHERKPETILAGTRVTEASHYHPSACIPVLLDPLLPRGDSDVLALENGIRNSRHLRLARTEDDSEVRVYLVPPRKQVSAESPVPTLGPLWEETWAVVGRNGRLLMPRHRRGETDVVSILVNNLEKRARYQWIMGLSNPGTALKDKVEVKLLRRSGPDGAWEELEKGSSPLLCEGDFLALEVVHGHREPLHIYVLDFGLSGRIELVYPAAGVYDPLCAHKPHRIWTREGEEVELYVPEDYPFDSTGIADEKEEGTETLKIVATTHPADFFPLFQSAYRGAEGSPREGMTGSLNDLIAANFDGIGYREVRRTRSEEPEDWTTTELSFRLRRR
ncbi:MAG TPA: caspase family protein [Thermoanaerobaculia bacterium]